MVQVCLLCQRTHTHTDTHTQTHTYPSYPSETVCDGASCVLYARCFPEGSLSPSTDLSSPELAVCYNLHGGLEEDSGAENDEFSENGTEVWRFSKALTLEPLKPRSSLGLKWDSYHCQPLEVDIDAAGYQLVEDLYLSAVVLDRDVLFFPPHRFHLIGRCVCELFMTIKQVCSCLHTLHEIGRASCRERV